MKTVPKLKSEAVSEYMCTFCQSGFCPYLNQSMRCRANRVVPFEYTIMTCHIILSFILPNVIGPVLYQQVLA